MVAPGNGLGESDLCHAVRCAGEPWCVGEAPRCGEAFGDPVAGAGGPERRIVETGSFSVDFIEILEGLSEGELVYLSVPDSMRTDENLMSTAL